MKEQEITKNEFFRNYRALQNVKDYEDDGEFLRPWNAGVELWDRKHNDSIAQIEQREKKDQWVEQQLWDFQIDFDSNPNLPVWPIWGFQNPWFRTTKSGGVNNVKAPTLKGY